MREPMQNDVGGSDDKRDAEGRDRAIAEAGRVPE